MDDSCGHSRVAFILIPEEMKWPLSCISIIKTLFFASDGYAGMGRKDIYKVDVEQVTPPLNIGITVNTQRDEFGFMVDASGQWGYFSSDISGKRCIYDIG